MLLGITFRWVDFSFLGGTEKEKNSRLVTNLILRDFWEDMSVPVGRR